MDIFRFLQYRIMSGRGGLTYDEHGYFQLFLNHLAERHNNNIYQNIQQDANYQEAAIKENELNEQYKKINLSDKQQKIITQWIVAIQAQESAYIAVVFLMSMQFCFPF